VLIVLFFYAAKLLALTPIIKKIQLLMVAITPLLVVFRQLMVALDKMT
jgi:hypothetical protein